MIEGNFGEEIVFWVSGGLAVLGALGMILSKKLYTVPFG